MGWCISITWWIIFCIRESRLFSWYHQKHEKAIDNFNIIYIYIYIYIYKVESTRSFLELNQDNV